MELETWGWLIIFIILVVLEFISLGLTTVWFAGGALAAFLANLLGVNIVIQVIIFLVVSVLLLVFTRPILLEKFNKGREKTNVESLIGQQAIVLEDINNLLATGHVEVNGMEWTARSSVSTEIILKGNTVSILEIQGVKLIVKMKEEV